MNRQLIINLWNSKSSLQEYPDFTEIMRQYSIYYLRCYLKIPTIPPPNIDYGPCVELLKWITTKDIRLPLTVLYFDTKPVLIITWEGQQPYLPSILLNSHMDVPAVYRNKWVHRPFDAEWDEAGNIYGRGSQSSKCVGIQYLEAIRELRRDKIMLSRTIHVTYVADGEIGGYGKKGMKNFVRSSAFKRLNVGFALDVGMPNTDDTFCCYTDERCRWLMRIHCYGDTEHSTTLGERTAGEKLTYLLNKFYEFRQSELNKMNENPQLKLGDITSINLTMLKGGLEYNIIPLELVMVVDNRIAPDVDLVKYQEKIDNWCYEAGEGIWIEYLQKQTHAGGTSLDESNSYWMAFLEAVKVLGITINNRTNPCSTDVRYLREKGIPSIGFSAVYNTPKLTHNHGEFINVKQYLLGIDIYAEIIQSLGNTPYHCKCEGLIREETAEEVEMALQELDDATPPVLTEKEQFKEKVKIREKLIEKQGECV